MSVILSIEGLVKTFGGLIATDHVSLEVREGEIHALIGPNGAGKSTLINQLCGELVSDAGTIHLAGKEITGLKVPDRVALGLGRTFQITSLLDEMTVLENVGMAIQVREGHNFRILDLVSRRRTIWQEAEQRIADSGLSTRAGIRVADLSHGEKKQLELLVALAMKPRLLLLDEPMAGLGHVESQAMIGMLRETRKTAAMLLVEHDMEAVFALADRISVLVYGRVIASGTVDEIRNNPAVREAYLGAEDELC
ncbi:ATP-binding cassette domain-containing protein [Microvirga tunisiensis]|uniref:ATP-binding cassette domain-containing protein n=1 Tax=Pannonibacter tanglangensis TaxID=2750084 RepID=A0A7X5F205_9HYPH|nr:ABC transporter ATP-binding protein [Pannonibacter sp. XCT-53]NBN78223.1 ATP-binding cassette domain-containing protein [Pannonibacter sp. XCT-53]